MAGQSLVVTPVSSGGGKRPTADVGLSEIAHSMSDTDIGRLGVGNVASLSMVAAPAPGQNADCRSIAKRLFTAKVNR